MYPHKSSNGFGEYARSDIDIFVSAQGQEEADAKITQIYERICQLERGRLTTLRTPNSLTIVRDWPERHIQIIVLHMRSMAEHLLFADLDCTALAYRAGQVMASSRSLRALRTGKNVVPESMLAARPDTPKRVGLYMRRGFRGRKKHTKDFYTKGFLVGAVVGFLL